MADKKVSNRQKMINMMYLVLLALVALNVSAEILEAFESLRLRLQKTSAIANQHEETYVAEMKRVIDEEVNNLHKLDNVGLKDTLDLIRERSREVATLIDQHLHVMAKLARQDSVSGEFLKKDETEKNFQYWMGEDEESNQGRGNGQAFSLRNELDRYAEFIAKIYNLQTKDPKYAIEPERITDPTRGKKSWERFTFEGPVIGNMAILESLKIDLYQQEDKLYELLQSRLGRHKFVADTVIAINSPVSTIVTAGLPFQTRLNVALSSTYFNPAYQSQNGAISLENAGNTALLRIPASGAVIPDGKSEGIQFYSAMIEVPTAFGDKQRIMVKDQFIVRRPEILVTSTAVQVLYRQCGNTVNIDVPALGDYYNPIIDASNAFVRQHASHKKQFLIVPNGQNCKVSVSSQTNGQQIKIGDVRYKVINPPKPSIKIKVGGREFNGFRPINAASGVSLQIIADQEFEDAMSKDANYRIESIEVFLDDVIGPPRKVGSFRLAGRNETKPIRITFSAEVRQAKAGTSLFLKVNKVLRKNFKGELIEDKRFTERELTLPFILD